MDYNNEEDYDAYLPKRSDTIYQEIESFEEYELTQCVAYEMAIRNEDVITLVHKYTKYYFENEMFDGKLILNTAQVNEYGLILSNKFLINPLCLYINYHFFSDINNERKKILQGDKKYKNLLIKFQNFACDYLGLDKNYMLHKDSGEKIFFTKYTEDYEDNFDDINNKECTLSKEYTQYFKGKHFEIITHYEECINEDLNILHRNSITPNFARPELINDTMINPKTEITLNMAMPTNELTAFITLIKKDLEVNKNILKSPIELLGEELQKATPTKNYPKKPKAEKMADMFFVYDYVKARQNKIKELNADEELRYKKELQRISNDKDLSTREKKIQKVESKAEHLASIIDTKVTDIFKEETLLNQLKMSSENISKMYYVIKPYINDCKYKELITGVSAL